MKKNTFFVAGFAACAGMIAAFGLLSAVPAYAAESKAHPKEVAFSFEEPLGTFDRGALQRGFLVYKQICANCHSLDLLAYRNLGDKGGPFECLPGKAEEADGGKSHAKPEPFCPATANDNPVVKAIAAEASIPDRDENGDDIERPGKPADRFHRPFANEQKARGANGGALPPDLSLIVKARHGGARYIYSLLTGYRDAPAGLEVPAGKYYNPFFPGDVGSIWKGDKNKVPVGGVISMPPPLASVDAIEFADGTKATPEQAAHDIATFLAWAAEPKVEARKQTGFAVIVYLVILAGLLFIAYKAVWRDQHH